MALDIRHDAVFHTNARLGMFFAQTPIEVWEIKELHGNIECEEITSSGRSVCSDLSGSVKVEAQVGP
jgi:hypothetical protein